MINQCPHCQKAINLSEAQRQKIEAAYGRLEPGAALKIGCPHCGQSIQLKKGGVQTSAAVPAMGGSAPGAGGRPTPPGPPDTSWLQSGKFEEKEEVREVPKALILMPEGQAKANVSGAFVELFYQALQARSSQEAIEQMRFVDFQAVVLHSGFDAGGLQNSAIHQHMCRMAMNKRRNIFYVLVGPQFNTFYNLEALANSANMVVNDNDTRHMKNIIKKGVRETEELFAPFLQALKALGKK